MTMDEIREKLEAKDYLFYFFEPEGFTHGCLARLFLTLDNPDKAKKVIFYWVFISHDCQKKFKPDTIQLMEAVGRIVDRCSGQSFCNLWELIAFTKGLYERDKD